MSAKGNEANLGDLARCSLVTIRGSVEIQGNCEYCLKDLKTLQEDPDCLSGPFASITGEALMLVVGIMEDMAKTASAMCTSAQKMQEELTARAMDVSSIRAEVERAEALRKKKFAAA